MLALNLVRNFGRYHGPMLRKLTVRLRESDGRAEAREWCTTVAVPLHEAAGAIDPDLWHESCEESRRRRKAGQEVLASVEVALGGGGDHELLYWIVRKTRPQWVVETGVAAGWSSWAILSALERNGDRGILSSSDLPYFREENPEQYVGILVPESLRRDWELQCDGDRKSLPAFLKRPGAVDLFHYDSDKSRSGREWAMRRLSGRLSEHAIVMFDDVDDNTHFRDLVSDRPWGWAVHLFEGKYVGVTGPGFTEVFGHI